MPAKHTKTGDLFCKSKVLKPRPNLAGHLGVGLHYHGVQKSFEVHVLVALTFLGPCPKGLEVLHGLGGVLDNSVRNLRYGTRSQNNLDKREEGSHGGFSVKRSDGKIYVNASAASEDVSGTGSGDCGGFILKVCRGEFRTAYGYGWQFNVEGLNRRKWPRAVRRGDGRMYNKVVEAAEDTGVAASNIIRALKSKSKTSGGFTWEYVE